MKVRELIDLLLEQNQDAEVRVWNGYNAGATTAEFGVVGVSEWLVVLE
jgi:hypothetical protein